MRLEINMARQIHQYGQTDITKVYFAFTYSLASRSIKGSVKLFETIDVIFK